MAARARSEASREGSLLLSMPDQVIVHILLQLTDSSASHFARRDALSALAFMSTCRRMLQLVESNNAVWAAMVRAELFAPEPEEDGKLHSTRARFRQLRRLSLTGLWKVVGRYAAAGEYSYTMQVGMSFVLFATWFMCGTLLWLQRACPLSPWTRIEPPSPTARSCCLSHARRFEAATRPPFVP